MHKETRVKEIYKIGIKSTAYDVTQADEVKTFDEILIEYIINIREIKKNRSYRDIFRQPLKNIHEDYVLDISNGSNPMNSMRFL